MLQMAKAKDQELEEIQQQMQRLTEDITADAQSAIEREAALMADLRQSPLFAAAGIK